MDAPLSKEGRPAPTLRVRDEVSTARVLRTIFFRHNVRVVLLSLGTLVFAAAAWVLIYAFCSWLLLLFVTVTNPLRQTMPHGFDALFGLVAICSIIYAWFDQQFTANVLPSDKKGIGEIIVDIILAVPRTTLAIGGTLRAWQHLSDLELRQAAALLRRLDGERRVPMSSVRQEIPDPDVAMRVILALQLAEIVEVQRDDNEFSLRLNALRPAALRPGRGSA